MDGGPGQAIRQAAREGNVLETERLLLEDPTLINARDRGPLQWTPLMGAAYCGHVAVVRALLDLGASLDLRDSEGGTALYLAADRCKDDVVALLLERGADPSLKARGGLNALMAASFGGHVCAVRVLLGYGGQQVDERSEYGQTALWWACANGAAEVARVLLVEGRANPHITDHRQGFTPEQVAHSRDKHACVAVFEWLKEQLDLPYTLHKARCVHEDWIIRVQYPGAPVPSYFEARVTAGIDLPRLEFVPDQAAEEQEQEQEQEQQQVREVIAFVVQRLHAELYAELIDCLRPQALP